MRGRPHVHKYRRPCCCSGVALGLPHIFVINMCFYFLFELDRSKQKSRADGLQYLRRVICNTSGGYFAIPGGVNADGLQYLLQNLLRAPSGYNRVEI